MNNTILFYGAQSFALSMCTAIQKLYPEYEIEGFLVTSLVGNPSFLNGLPVKELVSFAEALSLEERGKKHILIATPEDLHGEIVESLEKYGFAQYTCMDSIKEAKLMACYYDAIGNFTSLHSMPMMETAPTDMVSKESKLVDSSMVEVLQTKFYKDRELKKKYVLPPWVTPIQVGAALTEERVAELTDDAGENISPKNVNYCELTGLYWLWKNGLIKDKTYYGLCHYRRILDVKEDDMKNLKQLKADVILPFPTIHEPNINAHHRRYVRGLDWQAMLQALQELQPAYYEAMDEIFSKSYFYNYNMIIAKKQILADYCAWLFPILERTEELSEPKGWERADRYIGYLGENLMTLYFMYHKNDLNIVHTGRIMLT